MKANSDEPSQAGDDLQHGEAHTNDKCERRRRTQIRKRSPPSLHPVKSDPDRIRSDRPTAFIRWSDQLEMTIWHGFEIL